MELLYRRWRLRRCIMMNKVEILNLILNIKIKILKKLLVLLLQDLNYKRSCHWPCCIIMNVIQIFPQCQILIFLQLKELNKRVLSNERFRRDKFAYIDMLIYVSFFQTKIDFFQAMNFGCKVLQLNIMSAFLYWYWI